MATFIIIGYGDEAGYERTPPGFATRPTPTASSRSGPSVSRR